MVGATPQSACSSAPPYEPTAELTAADREPRSHQCALQVTLTLSILGSSVLPVPFAISRTGVLLGLLTMLVVSCSLLAQCSCNCAH